jgi:hypothetical protein
MEEEIVDLTTPKIDFSKYQIDLEQEYKEPKPLVCFADKPIFTRGNISCISGKAKSRKTFLISLLTAQILESDYNARILIFDTEQGNFHVQRVARRIHRLVGYEPTENKENMRMFALRELSTEERLNFVRDAVLHFLPDLVFIDGIRDLLKDFNDIRESSEIVNLLMKLSSELDCHICAVLHENKGDTSLRGHAGTELQNKAETVISVTLDGTVTAVEPKFCRNMPFEPFHFRVNEEGLPEYCEAEAKPKRTDVLESLFSELLPATVTLAFSDLRDRVMNATGKAVRTAERYIKDAETNSIVKKNNAGLYLSIPNNQVTTDEDRLPF